MKRTTDNELLKLYHRLPVSEQRDVFMRLREQTRDADRVVSLEDILSDPVVLAECERLARPAGVPVQEFAVVVNPYRYSSYFARSKSGKCTIGKLSAVDYGRSAEVAETVVLVKAYRAVEFHHTLVPAEFDVHVLKGQMEALRAGVAKRVPRTNVLTIAAGAEVRLRLRPGCWITYVDHPLSTWIARQGVKNTKNKKSRPG